MKAAWLLGGIGAATAAGIVILLARSEQRAPFIGTWTMEFYPETRLILSGDGRFEQTSFERSVRGYENVTFLSRGTWTATPNKLHFSNEVRQAIRNGKRDQAVEEALGVKGGSKGSMAVYWSGSDRFYTDTKSGAWIRLTKAAPLTR